MLPRGGCGCPIPERVQGQDRWGHGQLDLVLGLAVVNSTQGSGIGN